MQHASTGDVVAAEDAAASQTGTSIEDNSSSYLCLHLIVVSL